MVGGSKCASAETRVEEEVDQQNAQPKVSNCKKGSEVELDDEGRIKITIVGATFVPSQQISQSIRSMIHSEYRYHAPWITWDEIPHRTRLFMFRKFKWRFCWDENIADKVYTLWGAKASGYLQQALSKAMFSGKKPSWICDQNWPILLSKWEQEEKRRLHLHDSETNKRLKRASPMDEAKSKKKAALGEQMNDLGERIKREEAKNENILALVLKLDDHVKRLQNVMEIMYNMMNEGFSKQNYNPGLHLGSGSSSFGYTNVGTSQFGVSPASVYGEPSAATHQQSRAWPATPGLGHGSHQSPKFDNGKPRNWGNA